MINNEVVTLSPDEEAEYNRLYAAQRAAEDEHRRLSVIARDAIKARNAAKRKVSAIQDKSRPLAAKKFPWIYSTTWRR